MPTADEIKAAGPPAGSTSTGPLPIGVPEGYVPPIETREGLAGGPAMGPSTFRGAANPYIDGDEWKPGSLSPEEIARVQQRMVDGGLLTGTYRIGVWDDTTRSAYRDLLSYANSLGSTADYAFDRWIQNGMGTRKKPKEPRAPLVARVSNPEDIKAALRSTFRDKLGTGDAVDDAALDRMVAAFQGKEKQFQQQDYDLAESGGTVVEPPSIESFADIQAKASDPTAYDSRKVVDAAGVLQQMLAGQR